MGYSPRKAVRSVVEYYSRICPEVDDQIINGPFIRPDMLEKTGQRATD